MTTFQTAEIKKLQNLGWSLIGHCGGVYTMTNGSGTLKVLIGKGDLSYFRT